MSVHRLHQVGGPPESGTFMGNIRVPATAHSWHDGLTARQLLTGVIMPSLGLSLLTENLPEFTSHSYRALASNMHFGVAALQRLEDVGYLLDLARRDAKEARERAVEEERRAAELDENNRDLSRRVLDLEKELRGRERELRDGEAAKKSLADRAERAEKEKARLARARDDGKTAAKEAEARHQADREELMAAHRAELDAREEAHAEQLTVARAEAVAEYKASPALERGVLRSSVVQYKNGFHLAVARIRRADPSVKFNDDFAAFDEADETAECEDPPPFDDRSEEEIAAEVRPEEEDEGDTSMPPIDVDPAVVAEVLASLQVDPSPVREAPAPAPEPEVREEGEVATAEGPAAVDPDEHVVID